MFRWYLENCFSIDFINVLVDKIKLCVTTFRFNPFIHFHNFTHIPIRYFKFLINFKANSIKIKINNILLLLCVFAFLMKLDFRPFNVHKWTWSFISYLFSLLNQRFVLFQPLKRTLAFAVDIETFSELIEFCWPWNPCWSLAIIHYHV